MTQELRRHQKLDLDIGSILYACSLMTKMKHKMSPEIAVYSQAFLLRVYASPRRLKLSCSKSSFSGRDCACGSTQSIMSVIGQDHYIGSCRWETSPSLTIGHLNASSHMTHKSADWFYYLNWMHRDNAFWTVVLCVGVRILCASDFHLFFALAKQVTPQ